MSSQTGLLNSAQMGAYVRDGYLSVKADYPADFHGSIFAQLEHVIHDEWNPGNNILPRVPDLQEILDHPNVVGALTSILGPNFFYHPHHHCHFNPPGSEGQRLHKDGYTRRQHRTRWVMAMYYPQDTTPDMGPTGAVPSSHYNNTPPDPEREVGMAGEAGTVNIVHYDIFHRGTPNQSDKNRYMVKFLVVRMEEPDTPSWDDGDADWESTGDIRDGMWATMWDWHRGVKGSAPQRPDEEPSRLFEALKGDSEPEALRAAYLLGHAGDGAVGPLMDTLRAGSDRLAEELDQYDGVSIGSQNAIYALTAMGAPAVPALADATKDSSAAVRAIAAAAIGEIGRAGQEGVPALEAALNDESLEVRRQAAEALGIADGEGRSVPSLIDTLDDEEPNVRKAAALSLARLGTRAEEATPKLIEALKDTNPGVRAKSLHALRRIDTDEARTALLKFLTTARWENLVGKKG